jgi:hypothetical protein
MGDVSNLQCDISYRQRDRMCVCVCVAMLTGSSGSAYVSSGRIL